MKASEKKAKPSLILFMAGIPIHNSVGVVWPGLCLQYFRQPLALGVGVVPEVKEKEQENQAIQADDVDEDRKLVGAILHEEILADVGGHHNKLDLGSNKERQGCSKVSEVRLRESDKGHSRVVFSLEHSTYQLNGSEVFLPPQVLLVVGAHSSQAIVRVHDNMDNTVKQGMECAHTTWNEKECVRRKS